MWFFAKDGFLSITQDRTHLGRLMIRARVKGDIENFFPDAKVERTEGVDYLYRASVTKEEAVRRLTAEIQSLGTDSFKTSVSDKRRVPHYIDVWSVMTIMQQELDKC